MNASVPALDAVIIGAGFAGMYQLHCLRDKLGLKARVLEAGSGVGGTWYWNRYPGARCDSESQSYMYYFDRELVQEWEWTERYPQQPEILRYLNHCADRLKLREDIQFDTRVVSAHYDEARKRWRVGTEAGEVFEARYVIAAVGCLSTANIPDLPGLDTFAGQWFHTGSWPHEGVDFRGKRVGVIGTGATGIQAIPVIAQDAAHLTVFQRTANYSVPARNVPLTAEVRRQYKDEAEEIYEIMHSGVNGHPFRIADRSAVETPEDQRRALYEKAWETGGLRFRATFRDLLSDPKANETAAQFILEKIRGVVKDPEKARILTDIDHPFAAKRPPIDTNYFETFNRDNVSVVSLRETPLVAVTPQGVRTSAGDIALDILVFATGFDAMTGTLLKMDVQGRPGHSLRETWKAGPRNYLGLQVPGYPNFFTVTGPGSPSVLVNLPPAIEQHVDWITECIRHMEDEGFESVEAEESASEAWRESVNAAAHATLLAQVKHSWYWGANVPGKPRVFMPYAGGFARYTEICREVTRDNYRGFRFTR